ncbi:MAG: GNAT family N-acetyltransferase [Erysipelotrichales bacterium]|nr:GNAT family N-acetyltransferase [Erysipelotrichales bacterium]
MLKFEKFKEGDVDILSPMMKKSFDEDSRIHLRGQAGGPPGYDDGSFLKKWFLSDKATAFVIFFDDIPIGGINLFINSNGINYLGCIFIDPKCENKGYGKKWYGKKLNRYILILRNGGLRPPSFHIGTIISISTNVVLHAFIYPTRKIF